MDEGIYIMAIDKSKKGGYVEFEKSWKECCKFCK
jgi:hypothetical protein